MTGSSENKNKLTSPSRNVFCSLRSEGAYQRRLRTIATAIPPAQAREKTMNIRDCSGLKRYQDNCDGNTGRTDRTEASSRRSRNHVGEKFKCWLAPYPPTSEP